jgi:hypothetical protein
MTIKNQLFKALALGFTIAGALVAHHQGAENFMWVCGGLSIWVAAEDVVVVVASKVLS